MSFYWQATRRNDEVRLSVRNFAASATSPLIKFHHQKGTTGIHKRGNIHHVASRVQFVALNKLFDLP